MANLLSIVTALAAVAAAVAASIGLWIANKALQANRSQNELMLTDRLRAREVDFLFELLANVRSVYGLYGRLLSFNKDDREDARPEFLEAKDKVNAEIQAFNQVFGLEQVANCWRVLDEVEDSLALRDTAPEERDAAALETARLKYQAKYEDFRKSVISRLADLRASTT